MLKKKSILYQCLKASPTLSGVLGPRRHLTRGLKIIGDDSLKDAQYLRSKRLSFQAGPELKECTGRIVMDMFTQIAALATNGCHIVAERTLQN